MNNFNKQSNDEPSDERLDQAIAAVRSLPLPAEAVQRAVESAALWSEIASHTGSRRRYRLSVAWLSTVAATSVFAIAILFSIFGQTEQSERATSDPELRTPTTFYEPVSMTQPVMADAAPIIASIGPRDQRNLARWSRTKKSTADLMRTSSVSISGIGPSRIPAV